MKHNIRDRYEGKNLDDVVHLDNIKYNMLFGSIKPEDSLPALHGEFKLKPPIKQCIKHAERCEV